MRKITKDEKGITLMSLIIYITVMFVVLALIMRITLYFTKNMDNVADTTFETEFEKFNIYMLQETKKTGNYVTEVAANGTSITFGNGNAISFLKEQGQATGEMYFNQIKICGQVQECSFKLTTIDEETLKETVTVNITINSNPKEVKYVISLKALLLENYQEVRHIGSTGTQYIDTGIPLNSNIKLYIDNELINTNTSSEYEAGQNIFIFAVNNNGTVGSMASIEISRVIMYDNNSIVRYYIPCYSRTTVLDVNDDQCPKETVGLFDIVTNEFYTNLGTGNFNKGKDVTENGRYSSIINEEDYTMNTRNEE